MGSAQYYIEEVSLLTFLKECGASFNINKLYAVCEICIRIFIILQNVIKDLDLLEILSKFDLILWRSFILMGRYYIPDL